ncbi:MAG: hypothetical protein E7265_00860 [Lachnospiraceae bacterium]|nr:hypothetical protein [Lachnospiraceae bacterium]
MKKVLGLILCIVNVLCMTGCYSGEQTYDYTIFFLSEDENELIAEGFDSEAQSVDAIITEMLDKLSTKPDDSDLVAPVLEETSVISHKLTGEGYVTVSFDSGYNKIPLIKETLCRAAIVKSLCQIDGVNSVEFFVDGKPYADSNGELYGNMSAESFVDNTSGETTYKQSIAVNLYFADETGKHLVNVPANVTFDGTISIEQLIVQQIINGPDKIKGLNKELLPTVTETTVVNKITVLEQICYIDLNKDFLNSVDGVDKEVSLYSIVNALVDLPNINKVQFSIDGNSMEYFGVSSIVFNIPLERNLELIKG